MIIEEIQWEFKLLYNKINSGDKRSFHANEIDTFINRSIDEYAEMFYKGVNAKGYNIGFEVTQQKIDMLSTLVIGSPEQPMLTSSTVTNGNMYEFKLSDLKYDYLHHVRMYAKIKNCDGFYNVAIEQTDDLNKVLDSSTRMPSNKWKRVVGQFRKSSTESSLSSIYLYTNGLFEIEGLHIEYLKKPQKVALGTYIGIPTLNDPNPGLVAQSQCDLPETYHHLIVDIAVQEASRVLGDVNSLQLRQERINKIA